MTTLFDLRAAIESGKNELAKRILVENPDFARQRCLDRTWLHYAAHAGNVEMMTALVSRGLDVEAAEEGTGMTPLDEAAMCGHLEAARCLLRAGARIQATTSECGGTIIAAATSGNTELVRLLLDRGADPGASYGSPPRNALSHAVMYGHTEIADLLRSRGVTPPEDESRTDVVTPHAAIIQHFNEFAGPVASLSLIEIVPGSIAVSIHMVPAPVDGDPMLLFTTGMSDRPLNVPPDRDGDPYTELMFPIPGNWPISKEALADPRNRWPIDWLRQAAHYFHDENSWIRSHDILVNGTPPQPLAPGVPFDSLLLRGSLSNFSQIALRDGQTVCMYEVVPLYPAEREYEKREGYEALFHRLIAGPSFHTHGVQRPSAV